MEKVRLVFIFSRPVSPGFLKILKDAKCVVKLNDNRKMTYFSSPDSTVFESQKSLNQKRYFKGKPENYTKKTGVKPARRSSQNARNPLPLSLPPIIPNPLEIDDVEMKNKEEEEAPGPLPTNNWNIQIQHALAGDQHNDVQNPKARDCRNFELNENNTYPSQPERILQQLQKGQWDFWQFSTSRRRSKADTAGYLRKNLMFNDYKKFN
ncbi:unnamed protein product [Caenorhabditis nigoni]